MKKTIAMLLSLLFIVSMFTACGDSPAAPAATPEAQIEAEPEPEEVEEEPDEFLLAVEGQAFALAMAEWDRFDHGKAASLTVDDVKTAWEAAGWYAAWLYRTEGTEELPAELVRDLQHSLGSSSDFALSDDFVGEINEITGEDGTVSYDFAAFKEKIGETMGITTEYAMERSADDTAKVTVTGHYEDGSEVSNSFALKFSENEDPESAFPFVLVPPSSSEIGPGLDPELGFSWDELKEANNVRNILAVYPVVHEKDVTFGYGNTWLTKRGGFLLYAESWGETVRGQYRGCTFTAKNDHVVVSALQDPEADWDKYGKYILTKWIGSGYDMTPASSGGGKIKVNCTYPDGSVENDVFDSETLRLLENSYDFDGMLARTSFNYSDTVPAMSFLDSWDGELREVTLVWDDGNTETFTVPADWEVKPDVDGLFMDAGHTQKYSYPGDGANYTVYLVG